MKPIDHVELDGMQAAQESAMMDTCVLMRHSETLDELRHPVPKWTDGETSVCGLDQTGGSEQRGSNRVVVKWDARLRLPLNTVIDLRDRVRIILRFGRPCTPIIYEVSAPPEIGPSGMVVSCMKVQPGVE
jgi:hypothetical protein